MENLLDSFIKTIVSFFLNLDLNEEETREFIEEIISYGGFI